MALFIYILSLKSAKAALYEPVEKTPNGNYFYCYVTSEYPGGIVCESKNKVCYFLELVRPNPSPVLAYCDDLE